MALTDIFKKEENKGAAKKNEAAKNNRKAAPNSGAEAKAARKTSGAAARVLEHAHVTEKASDLADVNQYVFKVAKSANKKEIARAIESYYQVDVVGVNTVNVPGKRKRRGRGIAVEPGYRKAIVKIKKGQTIEIMPQ